MALSYIPSTKLLATRVETFATELAPQGTLLDEEPFGFANAPGRRFRKQDSDAGTTNWSGRTRNPCFRLHFPRKFWEISCRG